ncbi:MAG TPA: hypothetical protein VHM25_27460, partial [Polyangiaceae bacterium]|nr:hypothetical protein [Polyangiaceae bacterium]
MNHSETTQPIRTARARRGAKGRESFATARVTVSWTAKNHDGAPPLAPPEFELTYELAAGQDHAWTSSDDFEVNWLEALSAARCHEVVLTARLGDNLSAKHLVLELAEQLTFKLAQHQPLIRVLFLPSTSAPRAF